MSPSSSRDASRWISPLALLWVLLLGNCPSGNCDSCRAICPMYRAQTRVYRAQTQMCGP